MTKTAKPETEYGKMMVSQNHECGLCRRKRKAKERFRMDVDTRTGYRRSLLCSECYVFVHVYCRGDAVIMERLLQYATGQPMTPLPDKP